jgi:hypothetical protein
MELFLMIIEGGMALLDVLAFSADIFSWIKGRENRKQRRQARRFGGEIPSRDKWNRRVIVFTAIVIALTAALILWRS